MYAYLNLHFLLLSLCNSFYTYNYLLRISFPLGCVLIKAGLLSVLFISALTILFQVYCYGFNTKYLLGYSYLFSGKSKIHILFFLKKSKGLTCFPFSHATFIFCDSNSHCIYFIFLIIKNNKANKSTFLF